MGHVRELFLHASMPEWSMLFHSLRIIQRFG